MPAFLPPGSGEQDAFDVAAFQAVDLRYNRPIIPTGEELSFLLSFCELGRGDHGKENGSNPDEEQLDFDTAARKVEEYRLDRPVVPNNEEFSFLRASVTSDTSNQRWIDSSSQDRLRAKEILLSLMTTIRGLNDWILLEIQVADSLAEHLNTACDRAKEKASLEMVPLRRQILSHERLNARLTEQLKQAQEKSDVLNQELDREAELFNQLTSQLNRWSLELKEPLPTLGRHNTWYNSAMLTMMGMVVVLQCFILLGQ